MALTINQPGFYTNRIGTTESGAPVFGYFEPSSNQIRLVVVPENGNPYFASVNEHIHRETERIPAISSAVVGGVLGALLGGGTGAAIGAALALGVSQLTANQNKGKVL